MAAGSMPERSMAALIAIAPKSVAASPEREPRNRPVGVRAPAMITDAESEVLPAMDSPRKESTGTNTSRNAELDRGVGVKYQSRRRAHIRAVESGRRQSCGERVRVDDCAGVTEVDQSKAQAPAEIVR